MENQSTPTIPTGWRQLVEGEDIQAWDWFWTKLGDCWKIVIGPGMQVREVTFIRWMGPFPSNQDPNQAGVTPTGAQPGAPTLPAGAGELDLNRLEKWTAASGLMAIHEDVFHAEATRRGYVVGPRGLRTQSQKGGAAA